MLALPPPPVSAAHRGSSTNIAHSFWMEYSQYVVGSIITMVIASLNLLTDWFLFLEIDDLDLPAKVEQLSTNPNSSTEIVIQLRTLYSNLPVIYITILSSATAFVFFYVSWLCYMCNKEKTIIKNKWDGILMKTSVFNKYGNDFFILLLVIFHDLAISILLFLTQMAVSCRFVFYTNHTIYTVAIGTTLMSLAWKVLQLVWYSGCLGQRDPDVYSTHNALCGFRYISLLLIVCGSTLACWNLVLVTGWKSPGRYHGNMLSNQIMDKILVDRWTRSTHIMLSLQRETASLGGQTSTPSSITTHWSSWPNQTSKHSTSTDFAIVNLRDLLDVDANREQQFAYPCNTSNTFDFLQMFSKDLPMMYSDCNITFKFITNRSMGDAIIDYDFNLQFVDHKRACTSVTASALNPDNENNPWVGLDSRENSTLSDYQYARPHQSYLEMIPIVKLVSESDSPLCDCVLSHKDMFYSESC